MRFIPVIMLLLWAISPANAEILLPGVAGEEEDKPDLPDELRSHAACGGFFLALATSTDSNPRIDYQRTANDYWASGSGTPEERAEMSEVYLAFRLAFKDFGPLQDNQLATYAAQCNLIPPQPQLN